MKVPDEGNIVWSAAQLPGLKVNSCDVHVHDLVASTLPSLSLSTPPDQFVVVRSFRLFGVFLLSLLCVCVWMMLVSFLARLMDLDLDGGGRDHDGAVKRPGPKDRHRVGKSVRSGKLTKAKARQKMEDVKMQQEKEERKERKDEKRESPPVEGPLISPIVTLIVSPEQRIFVAHEDVLSRAPFFAEFLKDQFNEDDLNKVVALPEEEPEILSCILEFLYKGDYFPRLRRTKSQNWELEDAVQDPNRSNSSSSRGSSAAILTLTSTGEPILRDTAIYCAAEKYGLEDLKRLSLRKQGLQAGIPVDVILRSARYAYDNTPDAEYRLRAHYLAMIIRTRQIFKSSGTMQFEMEMGHRFFFDLFVAMCNHMDDLEMRSDSSFEMMS